MFADTNFDFLNARLKGMRSRLFEGAALDDLLRRHTLPELAQAAVGEPLAVSPGALERRLVMDHVASLARVADHMSGAEQIFFRALLERYRTENLKVVVRWRAAPEPKTSPAPLLVPLPDWLEMPYERLIAAPDLAALVEALPDVRLAAAARAVLHTVVRTGSAFFVEAALDRVTFDGAQRCHSQLVGSERSATAGLVGRERDVYNILFVVRAAQTYRLPFEDLEPFLVPGGGGITRDLLRRLHAQPEPGPVLALLPEALAGRREDRPPPDETDTATVERLLWAGLARMANRLFYRSLFDLGMAVAFFYVKRVELFNLIRVVEGVRYGLGAGDIHGRLILPAVA